jgi:SSS family solute:Na+ symporter
MILLVVAAYFAAMIWIGVRSARKVKGIDSFFVADRQGSALLITGSLLATIVGGSSTVGMAGNGFSWGFVGAWWMLVGVIGLVLLSFFLARKIRQYALFTLPELLERQYGPSVRIAASVVVLWAWLGIIGGQIVAAGKILTTMVPVDLSLVMVISTGVFIAYTILGGQISIIRTDTIQSCVLIAGIIWCAWLATERCGGMAELKSQLPPDFFRFPVNAYFSWQQLLGWLVLVGSAYLVGPDIYSRLFSSRDGSTARRSVLFTALTLIPLAFAIVLIGMAARVLGPDISAEEAFPYIIREILPWGINALVMAALLCAVMSSADTVLLTSSTILTTDVVNNLVMKFRSRALSEKTLLSLSRLAVVVLGLVSLGLALEFQGIIRLLLLGYSIYTGGLVVPVVLGFSGRRLRLNSTGAMAAILGGGGWVIFSRASVLIDLNLGELLPFDPGLQGVLLSAFLLFMGSYLRPHRDRETRT